MLALLAALALAQCTKDTDCKGERVCTAGECVEPAAQAQPPPALVPQRPPLERANAIARANELRGEISGLRADLDDATLLGPLVKLTGAVILAGVALGTYAYYQRSLRYGPDLGSGYTTIPIVCAVIGAGLALWGGLQLGLRLRARANLPEQIRVREEQLAVLEGQR